MKSRVWTYIPVNCAPKGEHRLFREWQDGVLTGRVSVGDHSGRTPDYTDDGPCFIDPTKDSQMRADQLYYYVPVLVERTGSTGTVVLHAKLWHVLKAEGKVQLGARKKPAFKNIVRAVAKEMLTFIDPACTTQHTYETDLNEIACALEASETLTGLLERHVELLREEKISKHALLRKRG